MLQIGKAIYTAVEDTEICAREEHISRFSQCPVSLGPNQALQARVRQAIFAFNLWISEGEKFMSVKIKLTRLGSKKHPFYRVVAANDCTARDGRPLEFLGFYNPMTNPAQVQLDAEKINQWLARGAQPTDTVRSLLRTHLGK